MIPLVNKTGVEVAGGLQKIFKERKAEKYELIKARSSTIKSCRN